MSILVTRPLPQGEELVSRLRALGRVAWSFPLIEFTLDVSFLSWAASWKTSRLAICSSHCPSTPLSLPTRLQQQRLRWPSTPDYFAIGRTTALALHKVSNRHVRYPLDREISEVLLQLSELQNIAGKRALILRGNGGRNYSVIRFANAVLMSLFVNVINVVQGTMMAQKKQCAGSLAVFQRWSLPAARCCSSSGR